jgi:hypothetical protein
MRGEWWCSSSELQYAVSRFFRSEAFLQAKGTLPAPSLNTVSRNIILTAVHLSKTCGNDPRQTRAAASAVLPAIMQNSSSKK